MFDDLGGSKMTPKSTLKPLSAPKGRLEASRAPFEGHLGSILVSFGSSRELNFELFRSMLA